MIGPLLISSTRVDSLYDFEHFERAICKAVEQPLETTWPDFRREKVAMILFQRFLKVKMGGSGGYIEVMQMPLLLMADETNCRQIGGLDTVRISEDRWACGYEVWCRWVSWQAKCGGIISTTGDPDHPNGDCHGSMSSERRNWTT